MNVLDLFAGPGGWDQGVRDLGIRPLGVEWDTAAVETGQAAGHLRYQADIADLDPLDFRGLDGLIASPPCQGFSSAGKGRGRADAELLLSAIPDMARRDVRGELHEHMTDDRSVLVLEPLRFALALTPQWMAWEQVPAVLPIWEECAKVLRRIGYTVATGVLNSEQYGVPQTRRRAVLVARSAVFSRIHGRARLPESTHSRYYSRDRLKLDLGVLPWVSMAQALTAAGLEVPGDAVRSNYGTGGDPAARGVRTADEPAAAVTGKVGRNHWIMNAAGRTGLAPRELNEPSATICGKGTAAWVYRNGNQVNAARRSLDQPAPTVHFAERSNKVEWMPTDMADDVTASGRRVTVREASVLQSFPVDYPWQSNKTAHYRQVGDAVPPLLAQAVVSEIAAVTRTAAPALEGEAAA